MAPSLPAVLILCSLVSVLADASNGELKTQNLLAKIGSGLHATLMFIINDIVTSIYLFVILPFLMVMLMVINHLLQEATHKARQDST